MNESQQFNDSLTIDDLRRYRAGQLTAAEQHRVERLLLEHPLYADALDGVDRAKQQGISMDQGNQELRLKLQQRIGRKPVRRLPVWLPAAAASVCLVIGLLLYWQNDQPVSTDKPAVLRQEQPTQEAPMTGFPPLASVTRKKKQVKTRTADDKKPNASDPAINSRDQVAARPIAPPDTVLSLMAPSDRVAMAPQARRLTAVRPLKHVVGFVRTKEGMPLAGATIQLLNSDRGTTTDSTGRFQLNEVNGNDSLQISFIGYNAKRIKAEDLRAGAVNLEQDTQALSEVVVIGYGTAAKKDVTKSVATIPPDKPRQPGTLVDYKSYLDQNRRTPSAGPVRHGTVRLRFHVRRDGRPNRFKIIRSLDLDYDREAIRLIQQGPRWQPAIRRGKPVGHMTEYDVIFP